MNAQTPSLSAPPRRPTLKARMRPHYRRLRDLLRAARYSYYDFARFLRYSGAIKRKQEGEAIEAARITKFYHMIEKGLALPSPRPSFGHYAIDELSTMLEKALSAGHSAPHIRHALETLTAYRDFNDRTGGETPPAVARVLALAANSYGVCGPQAVREVTRGEIEAATAFDPERFFGTRFSVRQFSDRPVVREKIEAAARIAQTAPAVCNRQSGRIHIVVDRARRDELLKFQNGNRGFGDTMGALAIITVDLSNFLEPAERYQAWIDGGLFAMSFIYGLHAQRLGSCCLNWSSASDNDVRFRRVMGLRPEETVITFIAIGELPDEFLVARSPRKSLDDVLRYDERI